MGIVPEVSYLLFFTYFVQISFTIVSKWSVSNIVTQGDSLDQILVEPQEASNRARNFRYQLYMQDPVSNVIVLKQEENLGFVNVAAVSQGMDDPIGIMEICRSDVLGVRDGFRL